MPLKTRLSPSAGLLQYARMKSGLTQRQVAERAERSTQMISSYERGVHEPTMSTLVHLLKANGYELRLELVPYNPQSDQVDEVMAKWSPEQRAGYDAMLEELHTAALSSEQKPARAASAS